MVPGILVSDSSLEHSQGTSLFMPFPRLSHLGSHLLGAYRRGTTQNPRFNQNCQEARTPRGPGPGALGRGGGEGTENEPGQGRPGKAEPDSTLGH